MLKSPHLVRLLTTKHKGLAHNLGNVFAIIIIWFGQQTAAVCKKTQRLRDSHSRTWLLENCYACLRVDVQSILACFLRVSVNFVVIIKSIETISTRDRWIFRLLPWPPMTGTSCPVSLVAVDTFLASNPILENFVWLSIPGGSSSKYSKMGQVCPVKNASC